MSSKHNDTIHLGNYEEYFILYMDGELAPEAMAEVDRFLEAHPDLRAELDLLMSTKLPMTEEPGFDKSFLMADQMKLGHAGEDLLLFIDGELPEARAAVVASQIEQDEEMARQHALLLRTRLDATEIVAYPNKEELFRHTEKRVVYFRPWMRAAAAVLLVGSLGLLWLNRGKDTDAAGGMTAVTTTTPATTQDPVSPSGNPAGPAAPAANDVAANEGRATKASAPEQKPVRIMPAPKEAPVTNQLAQSNPAPTQPASNLVANAGEQIRTIEASRMVEASVNSAGTAMVRPVVNNSSVTNLLPARSTDSNTPVDVAASKTGNAKGKVKGFLRKATTIFEKRTGIDPTDEDGKLLIGALAVKLD